MITLQGQNVDPYTALSIWYRDGSHVLVHDAVGWEAAPNNNIICILLYHEPPYRTVVMGQPNYRIDESNRVKNGLVYQRLDQAAQIIIDNAMSNDPYLQQSE